MIKIIWTIVALLLVGYFVNSYVENNAILEIERQKIELNNQNVKAAVEGLVSQSKAITDWATRLSNGESYRFEPILTIELENVWFMGHALTKNKY